MASFYKMDIVTAMNSCTVKSTIKHCYFFILLFLWMHLKSLSWIALHCVPQYYLCRGPFTRSNSFYVDEDNNLQKAIHESLQSQHLSNIHVAHDSFQSSADDHSTKASSWTKNLQTVPKQEQTQTEIQRQDAYVEKCYGLYRCERLMFVWKKSSKNYSC